METISRILCRFAHAEVARLDRTLPRLFGWKCAAEFKAIQRVCALRHAGQ